MKTASLLILISLLANTAFAQSEVKSLKGTMNWILSILNHEEVIKQKDSKVAQHTKVRASFNFDKKELIVESNELIGEKQSTKYIIPLWAMNEISLDDLLIQEIDELGKPLLPFEELNTTRSLAYKTKDNKRSINFYQKKLPEGEEIRKMTDYVSISIFPSQLKLNKNLYKEMQNAFKKVILLSRKLKNST